MIRVLTILLCLVTVASAMVGVFNPAGMGVAGFCPTQVPGIRLWLDAGRSGLDVGTSVSTWGDFSGSGIHAVQGTPAAKPTIQVGAGGRNVVRFDGVDDYIQTANFGPAISVPLTIFLVWKSTSFPSGAHVIMANSSANNFGFHNDGTSVRRAYLMNGGVVDTYAVSTNDYCIMDLLWNGTGSSYRTNNSAVISASGVGTVDSTLEGLVLGRTDTAYNWPGDLAEVIVYDRTLTEPEHASVARYLGTKYAIITK